MLFVWFINWIVCLSTIDGLHPRRFFFSLIINWLSLTVGGSEPSHLNYLSYVKNNHTFSTSITKPVKTLTLSLWEYKSNMTDWCNRYWWLAFEVILLWLILLLFIKYSLISSFTVGTVLHYQFWWFWFFFDLYIMECNLINTSNGLPSRKFIYSIGTKLCIVSIMRNL